MPEELDPTTARLVSELAANIIPSLTRTLNSAIPSNDFTRSSQDLRTYIDKAIRFGIDDNRAGRSVIMQSVAALLDEISGLKRMVEKIPAQFKKFDTPPQNINTNDNSQEYEHITELLNELIRGIQNLSETYAKNITQNNADVKNFIETPEILHGLNDSDTRLDKLLNVSLPGLEGLVRANSKSQSHELEELSREISAMQEQNNAAFIHEVREFVTHELAKYEEDMLNQLDSERETQNARISKMFRIVMGLSGACMFFMVVIIFLLLR